MSATSPPPATATDNENTTQVVALVSAAHFFSHFYMLLLPPLFPLMRDDFQVGFTELGFAITVYSTSTALTQAPMGFLVDRFGARGILIAGLMAESLAVVLVGIFPSYTMLLVLMALAGLGNAVFHPADYAILNARVPPGRIGRAFSIHTFSGLLGAAIAPPLVVVLANLSDWRTALILCGVGGGSLAMLLAANMGALRDISTADPQQPTGTDTRAGIRVLFTVPLLLAVLFFVGLSMFGRGINSFGISALELSHPGALPQVAIVLSAFLFASPAGVLVGGWVADQLTARHDLFVTACLVVVALCAFAVAAFDPPLLVVGVLFAIAGLASGSVAPSRDMMVRSLTPPGQSGKVFGFVSTGFNIGGIIAPPLFGMILDHSTADVVFWAVGILSLLTVFTVLLTGQTTRNK